MYVKTYWIITSTNPIIRRVLNAVIYHMQYVCGEYVTCIAHMTTLVLNKVSSVATFQVCIYFWHMVRIYHI